MALVHYWKLEETGSSDAIDSVGSMNLLVLLGGGGVGTLNTDTGKINSCRKWTTNNYCSTGDDQIAGDFTITMWFKPDSVGANNSLLERTGTNNELDGNSGYTLFFDASSITFRVFNKNAFEDLTVAQSIVAGTWYFVAIRHDAQNKRIYLSINGGTSTAYTYTNNFEANISSPGFLLGHIVSPSSQWLNGDIDEVAYFTNQLSDRQFANIYNNGNGLALSSYFAMGEIDGASSLSGDITIHGKLPISGELDAFSTLSGSLIVSATSPQPVVTRILTSNIDIDLDWDITDPDKGISFQEDAGELQPGYDLSANQAWYKSFAVAPTSAVTYDLTALPIKVFGIDFTRGFSQVKELVIENTSPSSYLLTGTSGATNSVTMFGTSMEIGYSGVVDLTSDVGFAVDSTKKNLRIYNPTSLSCDVKMLVIGNG